MDNNQLESVESILMKNNNLIKICKIGRLAYKLAQHAIFGDHVLKQCTSLGRGDLPALPHEGMMKLKGILQEQFPLFCRNPAEFEVLWESAVLAIQHYAKDLELNLKYTHTHIFLLSLIEFHLQIIRLQE